MRSLDTFPKTLRAMEGLIRGIRESDLKFLGDDSGCSVETGLERDRTALEEPGRL